MDDWEEGETPKKLDTRGGTIFTGGSVPPFCCKAWEIEPLQMRGKKGASDVKHSLALKLLAFINAGNIHKAPGTRIESYDNLESAKWLVQLCRTDCHPEVWVYLEASGTDEESLKEFCRGKDCFRTDYAEQRKTWKIESFEMISLKLVCKIHGNHWDCDIIEKKE